jgi:phosphate transport system permease protein
VKQGILGSLQRSPKGRGWAGPFLIIGRQTKDRLARRSMKILTVGIGLLVPVMALALLFRAAPIFSSQPLVKLLFSSTWHPLQGAYGFLPFIMGTLWVTVVGMVIAVPPSILTAIYLAEYASPRLRALAKSLIDLLAGIPSVVYGVWGLLVLVPLIERVIAPTLDSILGFIPFFRAENPTGYGVLAGGFVLAVMVFPIIIAVTMEVFCAVPQGLREVCLSLGGTRWQTVRHVVLRRALPGVLAAVVLGFSRAFGETMAVLMVVGNVPQVPHSIFDAAYPLTALIANNYGEMMSVPLYESALMAAALILLVVVLIFNILSRIVLVRLSQAE